MGPINRAARVYGAQYARALHVETNCSRSSKVIDFDTI